MKRQAGSRRLFASVASLGRVIKRVRRTINYEGMRLEVGSFIREKERDRLCCNYKLRRNGARGIYISHLLLRGCVHPPEVITYLTGIDRSSY